MPSISPRKTGATSWRSSSRWPRTRRTAAERTLRVRAALASVATFGAASACVAPVDLGGSATTESSSGTPVHTSLPPVPSTLTRVVTTAHGNAVGIDFDPVDDAVDYRVYPLPADEDLSVDADGVVTIQNAVYRCAGARQTFDLQNDLTAGDPALLRTKGEFSWNAKIPAETTLGHVYLAPGADRAPVYALGGRAADFEGGWRESRAKIYTTDDTERARLLSQSYRDDGIAFYVPRAASKTTHSVYHSVSVQGDTETQHYFGGATLAARAEDATAPTPVFEVLTAPDGASTKPLMVVTYDNGGHDELTAGKERFGRASRQGKGPLWHLEWSGLTKPTTLVVEALDSGCPYGGFLAASHVDAAPHQLFQTLDDLHRASPGGEVFVNGQFDVTTRPRAVARSFVTAAPAAATAWDFHEGFDDGDAVAPLEDLPTENCFRCIRQRTSRFEVNATRIDFANDADVLSYGEVLGQLSVGFDDTDGGTLGKVQLTANETATVSADPAAYLHVTFAANAATTNRRFPQLLISDQPAPLEVGLTNPENDTVIFQPRGGPVVDLQLVAVHGLLNGNPWALDNPEITARSLGYTEGTHAPTAWQPPFEHVGIDRMTTFDVYLSASRFYLLLDGEPAGCATLPAEMALNGAVTVTIGDVLFHEGAENEVCVDPRPFDFQHRHQCHETSRRFDDLAWKSNVPLPAWDETRYPCTR